jgi:ribonuclease H / adenosylcobalamin/alpha-ribazole phosphatase
METATLLGAGLRLPVQTESALEEVDFGDWTGARFEDLASVPAWRQFNGFRTTTLMPGGHSLLEVQARVVGWMAAQAATQPEAVVLAVTHADVIRSALAACAGISLDLALRLEIAPSSISEVRLGPESLVIGRINDTAHLEPQP